MSFHVIFGLPFSLMPSTSRSHALFTPQHVTHPSQITSLYHFHTSFFQAQPFHEFTCIPSIIYFSTTHFLFHCSFCSPLKSLPSTVFTFHVSEPYTIAVLTQALQILPLTLMVILLPARIEACSLNFIHPNLHLLDTTISHPLQLLIVSPR